MYYPFSDPPINFLFFLLSVQLHLFQINSFCVRLSSLADPLSSIVSGWSLLLDQKRKNVPRATPSRTTADHHWLSRPTLLCCRVFYILAMIALALAPWLTFFFWCEKHAINYIQLFAWTVIDLGGQRKEAFKCGLLFFRKWPFPHPILCVSTLTCISIMIIGDYGVLFSLQMGPKYDFCIRFLIDFLISLLPRTCLP